MNIRTTLALSLLLAVPALAADKWIGWKVSTPHTNNRITMNGSDHCVSTGTILIAARMNGNAVEQLRILDPICQPDLDGLNVEVRAMTTDASVDWLAAHLKTAEEPKKLITAIALHDSAKVVPSLIDFARHGDRETRRQSLFWLGQRAGEKAANELRRAVDEDPDEDVKQHAVFAISQLPKDRSVPILMELVKTHKSRGVRKKAMFWLAQTDDPRALALIEDILTR